MYLLNTELMKQAYGKLYEIENHLRLMINETMIKEYGIGWLIKAPSINRYKPYQKNFTNFYLHELVSMLSSYACLKAMFDSKEIKIFVSILSVRNKIAHCNLISDEELDQLHETLTILERVKIDL